jgi:hypothetical protein
MSEIEVIWGPLRSLLRERCTAYRLVQIVSRAGIDVTRLADIPLTQNTSDKNTLISRVDHIYGQFSASDKQRFLTTVTEELLEEKPGLEPLLERYLRRLGWKVHEGMVVPVDVFDVDDLTLLPVESHQDLLKASQRVKDGDLTGAISAACGAVDSVTSSVYGQYSLGDPGKESFQSRVGKALEAVGAYQRLKDELVDIGWVGHDADMLVNNAKKALNQGAYVLQKLRSDMGDVHGAHPVLESLVYDATKWAALTVRLLRS